MPQSQATGCTTRAREHVGVMARPTPLADAYAAEPLGLTDLLGWAYPTEFSSGADEHRAVRSRAGLFDFSFMAHFAVRGPDALSFVQQLVMNDVARLAPGAAMYSPICSEAGTFVDDCAVIRCGRDQYLINTGLEQTYSWLVGHRNGHDVWIENRSADLAVIAVQGPASLSVLVEAGAPELAALAYFRVLDVSLRGISCMIARIGYTGELGYELFVPIDAAADVWRLTRTVGGPVGLQTCGGVALNSLRIEAGYLMTQVDFDSAVNPFEVGLGRFVKFGKGDFIGRDALLTEIETHRKMTGLVMVDNVAAERGAPVRCRCGQVLGHVTSSCRSPTRGSGLALAHVACTAHTFEPLSIDGIRDPIVSAGLPFYDPSRRRVRALPGLDDNVPFVVRMQTICRQQRAISAIAEEQGAE